MSKLPTIFIVPHTHWDRAWYLPFEQFRAGLITLFERLRATAGDRRRPPFLLDGQTIIVDDYLALLPESRKQISRLARRGRVLLGPFYVQVDEFLAHPEAIIRNIQIGIDSARAFGGVTLVGYFPDTWGHILQLPQILRGFGIDTFIFGRGFGEDVEDFGMEFLWRGLDGTSIPSVFLPRGYINGINIGFIPKWGNPSLAVYDHERAVADVTREAEYIRRWSNIGGGLLMNGGDHALPNTETLPPFEKSHKPDGFTYSRKGLEGYLSFLRKRSAGLPKYEGHIRWGRYSYVVAGTRSSRMYLKQLNAGLTEHLVTAVEPLLAYCTLSGSRYHTILLERCWRLLLQNLAHDEIGGCSIDAVHREMLLRYAKVAQLCDRLERSAQRAISAAVSTGTAGSPSLVLFNPSNATRNGTLLATLELEETEVGPGLPVLFGSRGNRLDLQVLGVRPSFSMEVNSARKRVSVDLALRVGLVPAFSLYSIFLRNGAGQMLQGDGAQPNRSDTLRSRRVESARLENKHLVLEVRGDRIILTDLQCGQRFEEFLAITDEADSGDEYNFSPLAGTSCETTHLHGDVFLDQDGPLCRRCTVRMAVPVPEGIDWDRRSRTERTVSTPVEVEFTVLEDSPIVGIRVQVDNRAENHRLRLRFEFDGLGSASAFKGAHFGYETAPENPLPHDVTGWRELPGGTDHFLDYVCLVGPRTAAALFSHDTVEYERGNPDELYFTLLRGVGDLSRDDLPNRDGGAGFSFRTPDAQCKGRHRYAFGLGFFKPDITPSMLFRTSQAFLNPVKVFRTRDPEGVLPGQIDHPDLPKEFEVRLPAARVRNLAAEFSAFTIPAPEVVVTAFAPTRDGRGFVVRLVNYSTAPVETSVRFGHTPDLVRECALSGKAVRVVKRNLESGVHLSFRPFEIRTVTVLYRRNRRAPD